jgi:transcriptional regulator with XRE-family HTH domain
MVGIGKRLKKLRVELGLNQGEFAKKIKLAQSALSAIENETKPLTERNFELICYAFDVNVEWLDTGKGEMFIEEKDIKVIIDGNSKPLTIDESHLISSYRMLLPEGKKLASENIDYLLKIQGSPINKEELVENSNKIQENLPKSG